MSSQPSSDKNGLLAPTVEVDNSKGEDIKKCFISLGRQEQQQQQQDKERKQRHTTDIAPLYITVGPQCCGKTTLLSTLLGGAKGCFPTRTHYSSACDASESLKHGDETKDLDTKRMDNATTEDKEWKNGDDENVSDISKNNEIKDDEEHEGEDEDEDSFNTTTKKEKKKKKETEKEKEKCTDCDEDDGNNEDFTTTTKENKKKKSRGNDDDNNTCNKTSQKPWTDVSIDDEEGVYHRIPIDHFLNAELMPRGLGDKVVHNRTIRERILSPEQSELRLVLSRLTGNITCAEFRSRLNSTDICNQNNNGGGAPLTLRNEIYEAVEAVITSARLVTKSTCSAFPKRKLSKYVDLFVSEGIFGGGALNNALRKMRSIASEKPHLPLAWGNTNTRPREYVSALDTAERSKRPVKFLAYSAHKKTTKEEAKRTSEISGGTTDENDGGSNGNEGGEKTVSTLFLPDVGLQTLLRRNILRLCKTGRYVNCKSISDALDRTKALLEAAAAALPVADGDTLETRREDATVDGEGSAGGRGGGSCNGRGDTNLALDFALASLAGYKMNPADRTVQRIGNLKKIPMNKGNGFQRGSVGGRGGGFTGHRGGGRQSNATFAGRGGGRFDYRGHGRGWEGRRPIHSRGGGGGGYPGGNYNSTSSQRGGGWGRGSCDVWSRGGGGRRGGDFRTWNRGGGQSRGRGDTRDNERSNGRGIGRGGQHRQQSQSRSEGSRGREHHKRAREEGEWEGGRG